MSTPRSTGRKLLIALGALVGLAVLLVVAVIALLGSGTVTNRVKDRVLPEASKALGREVTLKDVSLRLFPDARVTLAGLAVAGRPGEPPLVELDGLDLEVALWPLVRSLGKDVEVTAFVLRRPTISLVKAKDGTWNFEGLGAPAGDGKGAPPPPAAKATPAPAAPGPAPQVAVDLVRIEQAAFRVIDRTQGRDDGALALTQLDLVAHHVGVGLPLDARLAAAVADPRQNLTAELRVARLPGGVPQRAEDWPEVAGALRLSGLALDRLHGLLPGDVGAIVRGGTASFDAQLSTTAGGYRVVGGGGLAEVRLRGQACTGKFRAAAAWSPARPAAARVDVTDLVLKGPGIDLGGHLSVETPPVRATFAFAGPLLDLDAVMGVLPEAPAKPAAAPPAPAAGAGAAAGDLVPAATRREIHAAGARGTLAIEKIKAGRVELSGARAKAVLAGGTLTLEDLSAGLFGGKVSAAGTTVAISEAVPSWRLVADLAGLDLEQTLVAFTGKAPLLGKLDGRVEVAGKGTDWEKVRDAVNGLAALAVKEGALTTTDLGDSVLGGLAKGLEALGKGSAAKKVASGQGGRTTFKDLSARFTVKDGGLTPTAPIVAGSSAGQLTLDGRIGLDGRLALEGKSSVPRATLAQAVSGVPLPERLEIPLAVGGTLQAPSVSVKAQEAAAGLVQGAAKQAVDDLRGKAKDEGKKAVEGLLKKLGR